MRPKTRSASQRSSLEWTRRTSKSWLTTTSYHPRREEIRERGPGPALQRALLRPLPAQYRVALRGRRGEGASGVQERRAHRYHPEIGDGKGHGIRAETNRLRHGET